MRMAHLREHLAIGRPLTEVDLLLARVDGTPMPVRDYSRAFTIQRNAAGLKAIPLGKLRHSNISRMRAAGIAADVVAAWHGHTERMTQAVYDRVTDDRLTAASAVFSAAIGQSQQNQRTRSGRSQSGFLKSGAKGIRTPDPHTASVVRYQLRHSP